MDVWVQSPLGVRETYLAQAVCYGEVSGEAKRPHLPSHPEKRSLCGTTKDEPIAAVLGFVENVCLQGN